MKFYLGTHKPHWLGLTEVPLFVSRRTLFERKTLPRALGKWALDSGGFTELNKNGKWSVEPEQYIAEVRRFRDEIGNLEWAAPQDWMCEPWILKKTGFDVRWHQHFTVQSVLELREACPGVHWIPVLQGWSLEDYLACVKLYEQNGFDLAKESVVGLGSVCRRQAMDEAAKIVCELASMGLRLHGFGFKLKGLERVGHRLASADSLAWSLGARRRPKFFDECTHKTCANCFRYAMEWRASLVGKIEAREAQDTRQYGMFA